ncbi:MAG: hypothetical protein R3B72_03065 [Polyangiaceae bacterium]
MRAGWLLGLPLLIGAGCKDEVEPVDVPFEGVDPEPTPRPKPPPAPDAEASATASAPAPAAPKPGGAPAAASMQQCCNALHAAARTAADEGTKRVNQQAASLCSQLVVSVQQGKITRSAALAQVRSSLLGAAPSSCR